MIANTLDHLWQSTIFAGIAEFVTLLFQNNAARVRFWLWFAASLKFLMPFSALAALGAWLVPPPAAPLPMLDGFAPAAAPFVIPVAKAHAPAAAVPHAVSFNWNGLIFAAWGAGILAVALHWLSRWLKLRAALSQAGDVTSVGCVAVRTAPVALEPGLFGHRVRFPGLQDCARLKPTVG